MALTVENVRMGTTGAAYVAPLGTTAPTDTTAAWAAGWKDLGWLNEDGITEEYDVDTENVIAWQNGAVVRTVVTESAALFTFVCIETKEETLKAYHSGSTISGTTVKTMNVKAPTTDKRAWGFQVVDGARTLRIIIPNGEVTDRGEIVYQNEEPVGYEMTVTAYPATDGTVAVKIWDTLPAEA